jgi:hypothetical protein
MKGQSESSSSIGLQDHASHYDHQGRKQSVLSAHRLIDHCVLANHLGFSIEQTAPLSRAFEKRGTLRRKRLGIPRSSSMTSGAPPFAI